VVVKRIKLGEKYGGDNFFVKIHDCHQGLQRGLAVAFPRFVLKAAIGAQRETSFKNDF
jgi:hypothetical protein